jgi:hypothetical protein
LRAILGCYINKLVFIQALSSHLHAASVCSLLFCPRKVEHRVKNDLASDRTADHRFLANHLRLFFSCAAYVLHQALRTEVLVHTELAKAQPVTVILKLFKLAVRVVAYQDRIKLHLPTSCPVKDLLRRVTDRLFLTRPPPLPA